MRDWLRRSSMLHLLVALAGMAVYTALPATAVTRPAATDMGIGPSMYPRLIRLQHHGGGSRGPILASVSTFDGGPRATILRSTDEGTTFNRIGQIHDRVGDSGHCCGTLYELPRRVGMLGTGTLVWVGSFGQEGGPDRRMSIRVWASRNGGMTWSFLSVCETATGNYGLWEPELSMDAHGELECYYGDDSRPGHSQVMMARSSSDGLTWGPPRVVVAVAPRGARPGMPVIRQLPDGRYFMSYEICNFPHYFCGGFSRISTDGVNWGDPSDPGNRISTADGHFFQHAQTITLVPGGPHGTRILSIGQVYVDAMEKPAPGNGSTVLVNDNFGVGPWTPTAAPIAVADPTDSPCPNYSSALLTTDGDQNLLEVATNLAADGHCHTYFAKASLS